MKERYSAKANILAYSLLAPTLVILVGLIGYPMIYNIIISFQKVPVNPRQASKFIGLKNYTDVLTDPTFWHSLGITLLFTALVVILSTALGLAIACFLNRQFVGKKFVNVVILLSYVVPSVCLIFDWRYMFNNIYGIINYIVVDVLHLTDTAPLWFDRPGSAFVLAVAFSVWRFFPYAYLSFIAILQTIDYSLYEAAEIDGASAWQKFRAITLPALEPTISTVVSLRTIWSFYIYTEVYLLTSQVDVVGVYLYKMAFATHNFGRAAAISILLFGIIFALIMILRKVVLKNERA